MAKMRAKCEIAYWWKLPFVVSRLVLILTTCQTCMIYVLHTSRCHWICVTCSISFGTYICQWNLINPYSINIMACVYIYIYDMMYIHNTRALRTIICHISISMYITCSTMNGKQPVWVTKESMDWNLNSCVILIRHSSFPAAKISFYRIDFDWNICRKIDSLHVYVQRVFFHFNFWLKNHIYIGFSWARESCQNVQNHMIFRRPGFCLNHSISTYVRNGSFYSMYDKFDQSFDVSEFESMNQQWNELKINTPDRTDHRHNKNKQKIHAQKHTGLYDSCSSNRQSIIKIMTTIFTRACVRIAQF